jgi:hypothetical protein
MEPLSSFQWVQLLTLIEQGLVIAASKVVTCIKPQIKTVIVIKDQGLMRRAPRVQLGTLIYGWGLTHDEV